MNEVMVFPFEPQSSYWAYKEQIDTAILRVMESGQYILGPECRAFEAEFASYLGANQAIGVGSGTDALALALRALGIGDGDLVATVSHTAVATVAAIRLVGADPVFVDIEADTYTLDPGSLLEACREFGGQGLRAVIPVHLYGHPAEMGEILSVAERCGLKVIEDCAQAHGASYQQRKVGTLGHMGAYSFYPTKNLGAFGDGGAVVTSDESLADRAFSLRQYGWKQRYISSEVGMNTRLDELQAAMLRVRLLRLDDENTVRRELADLYEEKLGAEIQRPVVREKRTHVYHQYVIQAAHRDALLEYLRDRGIPALIHYPLPVHLQPAYYNCCHIVRTGLAATEQVYKRILSLPIHGHLRAEHVETTCSVINEFMSSI